MACDDFLDPFSEEADQTVKCRAVTAIGFIGTVTNGTECNFMLLGFQNGYTFLADFNSQQVLSQVNVANVSAQDPLRNFDSISLQTSDLDTLGFVLAATSNYSLCGVIDTITGPAPIVHQTDWGAPLINGSPDPSYLYRELIVSRFGPSSPARNAAYFGRLAKVYFSTPTGSVNFNYSLYMFTFSDPFNSSNRVEWIIHPQRPVVGELSFRFVDQFGDFNQSVFRIDRTSKNKRILVMIWDEASVSLYHYDLQDPTPQRVVPFGGPTSTSTFFDAQSMGVSIDAASIYGEEYRRTNTSESNCADGVYSNSPSQLIWLVLGVSTAQPTASSLLIMPLPELTTVANGSAAQRPPFDDPAARNGTSWTKCDLNTQWFNSATGQCLVRTSQSQSLAYPAERIKVRYWDLPGVQATPILGDGKIDMSSQCDVFPANSSNWASCMAFSSQMGQDFQQMYESCPNVALQYATQQDAQLSYALRTFLYNVIFVSSKQNIVTFSAQQQLCTLTDTQLLLLRNHSFIGTVYQFDASPNAAHVLAAVGRERLEIRAQNRFYNICVTIRDDPGPKYLVPGHAALAPYAEQCASVQSQGQLSPVSVSDFGQFVSACPPGSYCPSLLNADIVEAPSGYYTIRSQSLTLCPPGYFCLNGTKQSCTPGTMCPSWGLSAPTPCEIDYTFSTTCSNYGTVVPETCTDGASCKAPYFPAIPAPPGFFFPSDERVEPMTCALGDWCGLGRSNTTTTTQTLNATADSLLCPAGLYCESSSVLCPVACLPDPLTNEIPFCDNGTTHWSACPAGYSCTSPTEKSPCALTQYCPPGTYIPQTCPAGFYCPSPSQKIQCPEGHFCTPGSVYSTPCPPFTSCPAGSTDFSKNFLGVFFDICLIVTLLGGYYAYVKIRDRKRVERENVRQAQKYAEVEHQQLVGGGGGGGGVEDCEGDYVRFEMQPTVRPSSLLSDRKCPYTIDFEFEDMGLELKNGGKKVLLGVTGEIKHGRVTAVMGPSGAGKTTFLTTLAGKASYGIRTGRVLINGKDADISEHKKIVGFVPQEDIMHRTLTCKEILTFNAQMRLPVHMTAEEKRGRVNAVIDMLGLTDVRHSVIGDETKRGISGGQRKRVNIGMELVADPSVLFLDEPTSGLDSSSSMVVCNALRRVADSGVTIVTVIHQPRYEIFKLFHDVLLLGKGGRTVYLGPSEKAIGYFEMHGFKCPSLVNPPDFFMDVIAGDVPCETNPNFQPTDLFKMWAEFDAKQRLEQTASPHPTTSQAQVHSYRQQEGQTEDQQGPYQDRVTPNPLVQLGIILKRAILQQSRELPELLTDFLLIFLSGSFLGLVYINSRYIGPLPAQIVSQSPEVVQPLLKLPVHDPIITEASLTSLSVSLVAITASLRVFGNEKVQFWREASFGLRPTTYFIGKNIAHLLNIFIGPAIYLSIFYSLTSPKGKLVDYYLVLMLTYFTATGFGYMVSILMSMLLAQLAGVVATLIFAMFSGTSPTLPQIANMVQPLPLLPYCSYVRWAQEALYLVEVQWWAGIYDVRPGMEILGYSLDAKTLCICVLFAQGILFRLIAYAVLMLANRDKRK